MSITRSETILHKKLTNVNLSTFFVAKSGFLYVNDNNYVNE